MTTGFDANRYPWQVFDEGAKVWVPWVPLGTPPAHLTARRVPVPWCDYGQMPITDCDHCTPGHRERTLTPEQDRALHTPPPATPYRVAYPVAVQDSVTAPLEIPDAKVVEGLPQSTYDYMVRLTMPTTHDEDYQWEWEGANGSTATVGMTHRTSSPSLLDQLASALEPLSEDGDGARVFASKSPARIDALDALHRIDREVDRWLQKLRLPRKQGETLTTLLRRVIANAPDQDIRPVARSWWISAQTATGWESPAFRPNNTCPLCTKRGGLRIRLDTLTASCVECGEGWDDSTIQLLGRHIRDENGDEPEGTPDPVAHDA